MNTIFVATTKMLTQQIYNTMPSMHNLYLSTLLTRKKTWQIHIIPTEGWANPNRDMI